MSEKLTPEAIKYIIGRVLDNANDVRDGIAREPKSSFWQGKQLAYYEVLDTIKNELEAHDQDLKEFGLDVDLDREYL